MRGGGGGAEGGKTSECANRHPGTSATAAAAAAAAEHLPDPHPQLPASTETQSPPLPKCPEASGNHQPPATLFFLLLRTIPPIKLIFRSSVVLRGERYPVIPALFLSSLSFFFSSVFKPPQFLEYLMENGDLRAAVRRFLPLRHPNCTHRVRLHADRRDPTLPATLHVSTRGAVSGGLTDWRSRAGGPHRPPARCPPPPAPPPNPTVMLPGADAVRDVMILCVFILSGDISDSLV